MNQKPLIASGAEGSAPLISTALPLCWVTLPNGDRVNLCLVRASRLYQEPSRERILSLVMSYTDETGSPAKHEIAGELGQRILNALYACTIPL